MQGHDRTDDAPLTSDGARALAEALFTGSAGLAWATRRVRFSKFVASLWGPDPAGLKPIVDPPDLDGPIVARAATRRALDPIARGLIEAFLEGNVDHIADHLDEEVWALWPEGFNRYRRRALAEHLHERTWSSSWATPAKPLVYGAGDARTSFALGIPEALDELLNLRSVLLYTYALDQHGRVMFALRPDGETGRLATLLLPSVDDAKAYSVKASTDEYGGTRIADRFVRHFVLGHGPALASMNNEMMPTLIWDDEPVSRTEFVRAAGAGAHRLDAAEMIFGGSQDVPYDDAVPKAMQKRLTRDAKKLWRAPLDVLAPRVVETVMVRIDPHTLGPAEETSRFTLMVRIDEGEAPRAVEERWLVAGGWG